ncbi:adenine/guanine phosphoribosyltransferase-like PRPP-binding protein [Ancylobacter aquaticus]|uniref:Adenine/guanine phosphoribosyltransferase-like PRPP-binding protein n=1 Tax=Ancylobacter aquaticus TaxID=100 RepID=A0A4R1IB73_ANCAQ|nr:phosphoribosyltransferase [Ancylobacter aquaticus]TCK30930.1 adenine/guanine phosphoribosyltransferase-like PRPP-binding protein [Ancylobacter aquaticus]
MSDDFTEPTLSYWQELASDPPARFSFAPPHRHGYPVRLADGRVLVLPLRRLPDGVHAAASLIANQASHAVLSALADAMTDEARALQADCVVGLPTLGLSFAALVAERLGHSRYAPLGYSKKFWYRDELSEPVSSITSPEAGKRLRLDPNLLPLVKGRRVLLVDDAISTGATALAAFRLLERAGARLAGMVVAMKQTNRWIAAMAGVLAPEQVRAAYGCPLFTLREDGWWPVEATLPDVP